MYDGMMIQNLCRFLKNGKITIIKNVLTLVGMFFVDIFQQFGYFISIS